LELAGQDETLFSRRFPNKEELIAIRVDAFLNDPFIGLVLVQELEFFPDDPDQGIPPEKKLDGQEEQKIQRVLAFYMHQFMGEDGRVLFQIGQSLELYRLGYSFRPL